MNRRAFMTGIVGGLFIQNWTERIVGTTPRGRFRVGNSGPFMTTAVVSGEALADVRDESDSLNLCPVGITAKNIDDLRALLGKSDGQLLWLRGFRRTGDGGEGMFYWDAGSSLSDNGGTVLQPRRLATGRWIRFWQGSILSEWFGVSEYASAEENTNGLNRAIASCNPGGSVVLPRNSIEIRGPIFGKEGITLLGHYNNDQQGERAASDLVYSGPEGRDFVMLASGRNSRGMSFVGLNINGKNCSRVFNMMTVRGRWIDCVIRGGEVGIFLDSGSGSRWNGEHRISGCSIEGQKRYGVEVVGRGAWDGYIQSNVIYNYGISGINFGSAAKVPGWIISGNHIYPGLKKVTFEGKPKKTIEIDAQAANFTLTSNYLEGGIYLRCTTTKGITPVITNNRIALADVENQVGIEIDVAPFRIGRMLIAENAISMAPGAKKKAVGIRITRGIGATARGRISLNEFGDNISIKYDFQREEGLLVND